MASHRRILGQSGFTTLAEHMPRSHQEHAKWTPERISLFRCHEWNWCSSGVLMQRSAWLS
ncbi:hypothetical protein DFAR_1150009 [Desulfarculales bacterium]